MNKILVGTLAALFCLSAYVLIQESKSEPALRAAAASGAASFCPQPQYRSDLWMKTFLTQLAGQQYDITMMKFLADQIPTDSHVFSTEQIISIFKLISFDSSRLQGMKLLNPYILTLTPQNIVDILGQLVFSSNKMDGLKLIANTINDVSDASKQLIINSFTFSSDQEEAAKVLNAISARNCIYGTITEKVAAFVIDISASMDYTFKANGETISRLSFVKAQLTKTISDQLKPYQKFNIIIFGGSASQWMADYVDATPENIQAAITYINKLTTIGSTNISAGLALAFNTKQNLNSIYLLSDGVPNSGITNTDMMKIYLNEKNSGRTDKIRINTISFIMGGIETAEERTLSFKFLNVIADATNGTFKGISQN